MRIGELAKTLGTTPEAIRFYERQGLLAGPARQSSGYRNYGPAEADRLRLLLGLRRLDLPLHEAARLATLCMDGYCAKVSDDLRRSLPAQRAKVRRQIGELRHLEARLADLERNLAAGAQPRPLIRLNTDDSRPRQAIETRRSDGMKQLNLRVTGMDCSACAQRIESTLSQLEGVVRSSADHVSGDVTVVIDPPRTSETAVRTVIEQAGYAVGS